METSAVRQRVLALLDRVRLVDKARRHKIDEAHREYETFLANVATPLGRQIVQVLKAEHVAFALFTPAGGLRLASERSRDDYIELSLDTSGDEPYLVGLTRRVHGGRVTESSRPVRACPVRDLTEDDLLAFLLTELEALLIRR